MVESINLHLDFAHYRQYSAMRHQYVGGSAEAEVINTPLAEADWDI